MTNSICSIFHVDPSFKFSYFCYNPFRALKAREESDKVWKRKGLGEEETQNTHYMKAWVHTLGTEMFKWGLEQGWGKVGEVGGINRQEEWGKMMGNLWLYELNKRDKYIRGSKPLLFFFLILFFIFCLLF